MIQALLLSLFLVGQTWNPLQIVWVFEHSNRVKIVANADCQTISPTLSMCAYTIGQAEPVPVQFETVCGDEPVTTTSIWGTFKTTWIIVAKGTRPCGLYLPLVTQ